jgi:hypothetical protein
MADRGHHIRRLDSHPKIHLRVDCQNCGRREVLTVYEEHVEGADFKRQYYECSGCNKTFCIDCTGHELLECPFCKRLKPNKIMPLDVYLCGVCFRQWWKEGGLCNKCKYLPKKQPDDGTYKGP